MSLLNESQLNEDDLYGLVFILHVIFLILIFYKKLKL